MTIDKETRIRYHVIDRKLTGGKDVSLGQLAAACSDALGGRPVDLSTVESDLRSMQQDPVPGYYAPIEYDARQEVYSYRDPGYSIEKIQLSNHELQQLREAADILERFSSRGPFAELEGVIRKLTDAAQIISKENKNRIREYVEFEKTPSFSGSRFLEQLTSAIERKKVVKIYYKPYEEDKPYFTYVHPYLLKEFRFRWYLVGLNEQRDAIRTYALDRVWEMEETDHTYIPRNLNVREYFKNSVGVIVPESQPSDVMIRVAKPQAQYLISQPLHESQVIREENDEYVVFGFHVHPTWEFKSMIRALGSEALILGPAELRKSMADELRSNLSNYDEPE